MFYTKEGHLHLYFLQMWYQDSVCYWSSVFHQSIFFQIVTGKVKDESGKNKKEDRRKKATGGKSGGGTQGRETKTKAVKNKHKGRKGASRDSDSEDDTPPPQPSGSGKFPHVEFLSLEDLQTEITNFSELADCPEELVESLASELNPVLTRQFQDVAQSAFLATVSAGSDARKKTHQQLVEKVSALLTSIRLAEKSIKVCSNWVLYDEDRLFLQDCKYLLLRLLMNLCSFFALLRLLGLRWRETGTVEKTPVEDPVFWSH